VLGLYLVFSGFLLGFALLPCCLLGLPEAVSFRLSFGEKIFYLAVISLIDYGFSLYWHPHGKKNNG
jgi:hypothetical protein